MNDLSVLCEPLRHDEAALFDTKIGRKHVRRGSWPEVPEAIDHRLRAISRRLPALALQPEIPSGCLGEHHMLPLFLSSEHVDGGGSTQPHPAMALHELKDALSEEEPQCRPSEAAVSLKAPRGKYQKSKAGWFSKTRSTPEGYDRDQHGWRFQPPAYSAFLPLLPPASQAAKRDPVARAPKKKETEVERIARRRQRVAAEQNINRRNVEIALVTYNKANSTELELVEITSRGLFFEYGIGYLHYNFTAKPKDPHSTDGSIKLFFVEMDVRVENEKNVGLCCIVGQNEKGPCIGCSDAVKMVVHPSSGAYNGGHVGCSYWLLTDSSDSD